ncbi:MAG: helix-turn-helix domain-containing protein [Parachlamydiaceae bacterium]
MYAEFLTPKEVLQSIADAAKEKRLSKNLSQKSLAENSGVSLGTLKKFEGTGKISLESLLKLALCLDSLQEFLALFKQQAEQQFKTLDKVIHYKVRKRGRR